MNKLALIVSVRVFFGHLYGNLMVEDIEKSWQIQRGAFKLPKSILLEAEFFIN